MMMMMMVMRGMNGWLEAATITRFDDCLTATLGLHATVEGVL